MKHQAGKHRTPGGFLEVNVGLK